jgi:TRAP-type C4-dicarboxylate transport system substrate-binding protein
MIFINENTWKRISIVDQKIINEAVANGITWNNAETIKAEEALKKSLAEKGVTIVKPDVESFRTVTAPWLIRTMESAWGRGTWEFIQNIK